MSEIEPQTCFVMGDFYPNSVSTGLLPCDDLRRSLFSQGLDEVLMFLDCCRSAISTSVAPPSLGFPRGIGPDEPFYGVGRAARRGKLAYEIPDEAPQRGAFSQVLVDGLRRLRDPETGRLTLEGLENYVRTAIQQVLGTQKIQQPQFEIEPRFSEEFAVLSGPPISDLPILITFGQKVVGKTIHLVDFSARRLVSFQVNTEKTETYLAPAGRLYSLESDDHSILLPFEHTGPGETHVVV